tara:strand:+ start:783 stop:1328 length:546 start_codon:yes stop_codon:yes gene_type:complete
MEFSELDITLAPPEGVIPPAPYVPPVPERDPLVREEGEVEEWDLRDVRNPDRYPDPTDDDPLFGQTDLVRPPRGTGPSTEWVDDSRLREELLDPNLEREENELTERLVDLDKRINVLLGGDDETISARVGRRGGPVSVWLADTLDRIDPGHTTRALDATADNTWPCVPRELIDCKKLENLP